MVNEADTPYRPDYFPNAQPGARDLPRPAFGRPQDVRGGNVKHVRTVAWSCDGRRIATGGEYKELLVWDAKSPIDSKPSITLPSSNKPNPHNGHVGAIAWSPADPNLLISGDKGSSAGGIIAIWNLTSTSVPVATFRITGDVLHIAFHPSGRQFAVVCPQRNKDEVFFFGLTEIDGEAKWSRREDIALGGALMDIGSEEINSLRFTNSGKLVCAVSNDGSINAWLYPLQPQISDEVEAPPTEQAEQSQDQEEQTQTAPDSGPSTRPSSPKATVDDETRSTNKSRAPSPREDTPDATTNREGEDPQVAIEGDVEMTEESREAGESTVEEEVKEPELEEKKQEGRNVDTETPTVDVEAPSPKGQEEAETATDEVQSPAETGKDGDVEMAEPVHLEKPSTPPPASSIPPSRRPSPPAAAAEEKSAGANLNGNGNGKASAETEKHKAKQLARYRHTICHSASLLSLAFDPQGKYLAVGGQDALLSMFDTRDWICERTFDACTAAIRQIAFSYDGEFIAFGGDDTFIAIVSVYTGATVAKLPVQGMVNAISWHSTKNWLAYSYSGKTNVPLWHVVHQDV